MKRLVAAFIISFALATTANAQAPAPFPDSGNFTIGGVSVPYTFKQVDGDRVRYDIRFPSKTIPPIWAALVLPVAGINTPAQAQAFIQTNATKAWGSLALPFPY